MLRSTLGALAGALLVLALCGLSAHASGSVICGGTATIDYSPPLTAVAQPTTATVNASLSPCVSPTNPAITSASVRFAASGVLSCAVPFPASGTATIGWNTGSSSTFSHTETVSFQPPSLVITLTGTISGGLLSGLLAQLSLSFPFDPLACITTGIARLSGSATLVVG